MKQSHSKKSDIFSLIKKDHRLVESLFNKIEGAGERATKTREKVFRQLFEELSNHAQAEETVLYPRLKEVEVTEDIGYESVEEHEVIKFLLNKIDGLDSQSQEWMAAVTVLKEVIEHHVEEEETEMFKKMRSGFSKEELEEFGAEFIQAKKSFIEKMADMMAA